MVHPRLYQSCLQFCPTRLKFKPIFNNMRTTLVLSREFIIDLDLSDYVNMYVAKIYSYLTKPYACLLLLVAQGLSSK